MRNIAVSLAVILSVLVFVWYQIPILCSAHGVVYIEGSTKLDYKNFRDFLIANGWEIQSERNDFEKDFEYSGDTSNRATLRGYKIAPRIWAIKNPTLAIFPTQRVKTSLQYSEYFSEPSQESLTNFDIRIRLTNGYESELNKSFDEFAKEFDKRFNFATNRGVVYTGSCFR